MADGLIHYNVPAITDAEGAIAAAEQATEVNRQRSLHTVASNAENFGGVGSDAFKDAIAQVNAIYEQSQEDIGAAGRALGLAKTNMVERDLGLAAQYP